MQIPTLEITGKKATLLSDGKPFLMLAGEAHNSSGSSLTSVSYTHLTLPTRCSV